MELLVKLDMPRIFLTDYASYNNGTQFEFGHWVDLEEFLDENDFLNYVKQHFKECDAKSPLYGGEIREEMIITDFEGFPKGLYNELINDDDLGKLFKYIEIITEIGDNNDWLNLNNQYTESINSLEKIYENNEDFLNLMFENNVHEAVKAVYFGSFTYMDKYITFNAYGNLVSIDEFQLSNFINQDEIILDIIENRENYYL